jgi:hypothetical protein
MGHIPAELLKTKVSEEELLKVAEKEARPDISNFTDSQEKKFKVYSFIKENIDEININQLVISFY